MQKTRVLAILTLVSLAAIARISYSNYKLRKDLNEFYDQKIEWLERENSFKYKIDGFEIQRTKLLDSVSKLDEQVLQIQKQLNSNYESNIKDYVDGLTHTELQDSILARYNMLAD